MRDPNHTRALVERDRARATAAALEDQLAQVATLIDPAKRACPADGCQWDERGTHAGAGPAACIRTTYRHHPPGCLIASYPDDDRDPYDVLVEKLQQILQPHHHDADDAGTVQP